MYDAPQTHDIVQAFATFVMSRLLRFVFWLPVLQYELWRHQGNPQHRRYDVSGAWCGWTCFLSWMLIADPRIGILFIALVCAGGYLLVGTLYLLGVGRDKVLARSRC